MLNKIVIQTYDNDNAFILKLFFSGVGKKKLARYGILALWAPGVKTICTGLPRRLQKSPPERLK